PGMPAEPGTVLRADAGHNKSISQPRSKTWAESREGFFRRGFVPLHLPRLNGYFDEIETDTERNWDIDVILNEVLVRLRTAERLSSTRSGKDTWRCKECHGWDYLGKDGAHGSGSHMTGFAGVYDASQSKTIQELAAALKGATNPDHDFSSVLDDQAIADLATFLKEGVADVRDHTDYDTKSPESADKDHGKTLFESICAACHGPDGTTINFKDEAHPEYIGTIANENPQEFLHKARFGQPGSKPPMPATVDLGWSIQDTVDVLGYAQTLPTE
ncbi:MAG TPA: hypothetical protein EYP04_12535, partial [Anaerolineae bacterium]|nr:hypothetical protein [Anaerolineae bacterium]